VSTILPELEIEITAALATVATPDFAVCENALPSVKTSVLPPLSDARNSAEKVVIEFAVVMVAAGLPSSE
jgi:hypothetical protein